jgi:hypothetical protein
MSFPKPPNLLPKALPLPVSFAIRLSLAFAISGGIYWLTKSHVMMVLSLPVWGVLLAKPIVETLETYFDFARKQPWRKWQGHYYEFQGHQIRIYEMDGALWFCDTDIFNALGLKLDPSLQRVYSATEYTVLEGTKLKAFSEATVLRVISHIRHAEVGKLKFWLEREVIRPHYNKKKLKH